MNSDDVGSRESASTIAASYPTTHTISCEVVSVNSNLLSQMRANSRAVCSWTRVTSVAGTPLYTF